MADVVKAAGFVIYRRLPQLEYLLLQTSYGIHHWTPPKGHLEAGEDLLETAYRETEEEAGIPKSSIQLRDYSKTINYLVEGKEKSVTYYLGELLEGVEIKLSHEHQALKWAPLEEACSLVDFAEMIKVLRDCDNFIRTAS